MKTHKLSTPTLDDRRRSRISLLGLLLALTLSSCNFPTPTPAGLSDEDAAGTMVAQTIAAVEAQTPADAQTPTETPTKPPPTLTSTSTPTNTPTPTYAMPLLTLEGDVNCRRGPGLDYRILYTFSKDETAEIVGKHPSEDFWVVKQPNSENVCWVVGEYASASGSLWTLPTMTPPPTETPSPPKAPTLQEYNFNCAWDGTNTTMTMTITWSDWANNEDGYRIYRNGELIAELGANTTTYVDTFPTEATQTINFGIEAHNSTGSSGQATFSESCQ